MSSRIVGRRGKIRAQTSTTLVLYRQLTPDVDLQTFASGNPFWVEEPGYPDVRLDGLISGGSVNPTLNNNEVQTEALSAYIAGALVSGSADTSVGVTRPSSSGNVVVNSIVVDSAGSVTNVAGTEGLAGGARGASGGPGYIPVGSLLLAEVVLSSTTAAKVLASEINTSVAERTDSPSYDFNLIDGKVKLTNALDPIHTGTTIRKLYVQYKWATMIDIGDIFDWNISMTTALVDATAFGEDWVSEKEGMKTWSGGFNGYFVNASWYRRAATVDGATFVLEFYPDRKNTRHWVGRAHLDYSINVSKDAMVNESISFKGIGELQYKDA